jgi:glycosyltransferase involved in cell wall biosynthesis
MASLAVCIATCDRPDGLARCLEAVGRFERRGLEGDAVFAVVVDNAPGGRTAAVCDAWRAKSGLPLVLVEERSRGISFARNRAIATALEHGADAVAFIDDDDEPEPGWLAALVGEQRRSGADLVFGHWSVSNATPVPAWLAGVDFLRPSQSSALGRHGVPNGIGTYNVLIGRGFLERFAPDARVFDPDFARCGGGDIDFFIRAVRAGARVAMARDSRVVRGWEPGRLTLRGVARRSFRLGHSQALLSMRHEGKQPRRRLRSDARKLGRLLLAFPLHLGSRASFAKQLARTARVAGRINADLGRDLRYYGGVVPDAPLPSSSSR